MRLSEARPSRATRHCPSGRRSRSSE
ncbi:hypothetical protein CSPAE12_07466 [Colletotrichum incanum]|nr:hypothetical protein CSPAE12_07466 [Colletotrichum incanum]